MTELNTMSVHALSERVENLEQQLAAANRELERVRDVGRWPLEYGAQVYANTALVGCEPIDCIHDAVNQMLKALASPAAEPVRYQWRSIEVTDDMALAFHHALTDGDLPAADMEDIKTGLRVVLQGIADWQDYLIAEGEQLAQPAPAAEPVNTNGWHQKFIVTRTDGSRKHQNCEYFVLDLTHDEPKALAAALRAYAENSTKRPELNADLLAKADALQPALVAQSDPFGLKSCPHPECGAFYDENAKRMACRAWKDDACPVAQSQEGEQ